MDNLENYLYLIFAVIYIISRIIKARSKQKEADSGTGQQGHHNQQTDTQNQAKPRKAFSFEDILKEFEKNLTGEERPEESPFPVHEIRHEKPSPRPEPVPIEKVEKRPSVFDKYQGTRYKTGTKPKEESFTRDEKYTISEDLVSKYTKILKDPEGIRDVVVLSEIFNRKYY